MLFRNSSSSALAVLDRGNNAYRLAQAATWTSQECRTTVKRIKNSAE